jgi:hypothetical protein
MLKQTITMSTCILFPKPTLSQKPKPKMEVFSSDECVVCLDAPSSIVFSPCRHMCTCSKCSGEVKRANLYCPLCRQHIDTFSSASADAALLPSEKELEEFSARKNEYVTLLRRGCAKTAGWTGGGKQARAVSKAVGNEYDERVKENAGTDRYGGMKAVFKLDDGTLAVTYKVAGKRKAIEERYQFLEWEEAKQALLEALDGDSVTDMDIATHYPEYFWLAKYHKKWTELVNELTQNKRRK